MFKFSPFSQIWKKFILKLNAWDLSLIELPRLYLLIATNLVALRLYTHFSNHSTITTLFHTNLITLSQIKYKIDTSHLFVSPLNLTE